MWRPTRFSLVATWNRVTINWHTYMPRAALSGAIANDYAIEDVSVMVEHRDSIKSLADTGN